MAKTAKQYLALTIDSNSIDKEKKQFNVVAATETPVFRRANYLNGWAEDYNEVLVCDKSNMRTERMDNGVCPLLDNHDQYSGAKGQYGSLVSYEVENGQVRATIQFSLDPAHDGLWKNIEAGIIRGISARYIPWTYERTSFGEGKTAEYRATDWEITEISLAPVPADFNSGVRSGEPSGETFEVVINNFSKPNTRTMPENNPAPTPAPAPATEDQTRSNNPAPAPAPAPVNEGEIRNQAATAERTRITEIRSMVRTANLPESEADTLIENGSTLDEARSSLFEKMAAKQNPAPKPNTRATVVGNDERDVTRSAMQEVILHRAGEMAIKDMSEPARNMRGMKLMDMARHFVQQDGHNVFAMSQNEAVARAISTTDFPDLLTSTVGRQLRKYMEASVSPWERLSQRTTVSDFRSKTGIRVDGATTFSKIEEGGEYKSASMLMDEKATIGVDTYGTLIKIGRRAIINDDLEVFARVPRLFAQGAQRLKEKMFWDLFTAGLTPDGLSIFHADHGNIAGAGGVLSETTLNAAIVAMAKQQTPAGEEMGVKPSVLLVPVELQTLATKLMASVTAGKTGDVNPFRDAFEIISEIRLSRKSATAWYLVDPSAEGIMHAYLDGEEGLYTESRTNFEDDSVETKARMEFGVAAWDYRGFYKNAGA